MGTREASGDWLLVQELFERGEPSFVDELRKVDDADALGAFAPRWIADRRPEARQLLLDYLDRPLNAFRHEALVKRSFKLAEAAGDDELMAGFLVAFDRAVRRVVRRRRHLESQLVATEREANALAAAWRDQGVESVGVWKNWQKKYQVWGRWSEPFMATPRETTMPRGALKTTFDPTSWDAKSRQYATFSVPDWVFKLRLDPSSFRGGGRIPGEKRKGLDRRRLFSIATRHYLRRRAWRYFRRLGRAHPERYIVAVKEALIRYRDEDAADGLALLDNWGLMHILFHFSPCLSFDDRSFKVADGHTLAELEPAPKYARLWDAAPRAFVDLVLGAKCRAVRGWAIKTIRRDLTAIAALFTLEERLGLLANDDPEVVSLAGDMLRDDPSLKDIPPERWMQLVETASPAALDILCELMSRLIAPDRITLPQAVRLAMSLPLPTARLGLAWLREKVPSGEEECLSVLTLVEAESESVRPEIVRWAAEVLSRSELFRPDWVLDWLDSRHEDVRSEGWRWFRDEPRVRDDVTIWRRLLETPYDDVRLALIGELEARTRAARAIPLDQGDLDAELLRMLWASVLLNVSRGSRAKPTVVRQILTRIQGRPTELSHLLPVLAVALRSVRGPEMRAGLAAVVRLAESDGATARLVNEAFPELRFL
jgi:hypothetical protein